MADEPRITDHDPILAAARADASRGGAAMVKMSLVELWRLIQRAPALSPAEHRRILVSFRHE